MLDDMHAVPAAYRRQPQRTHRRLLKLTALVAADRMLSRDPGLRYRHVRQPGPHVRISKPADRASPESFELRLLHFKAREW